MSAGANLGNLVACDWCGCRHPHGDIVVRKSATGAHLCTLCRGCHKTPTINGTCYDFSSVTVEMGGKVVYSSCESDERAGYAAGYYACLQDLGMVPKEKR